MSAAEPTPAIEPAEELPALEAAPAEAAAEGYVIEPEQWFALVERSSGTAVSFGTVVAADLPEHLEVVPVYGSPEGRRWEPALRTLVPLEQAEAREAAPPPPRPAADATDTSEAMALAEATLSLLLRAQAPGSPAPAVDWRAILGGMLTRGTAGEAELHGAVQWQLIDEDTAEALHAAHPPQG